MLKVILVLQALCSSADDITCHVNWRDDLQQVVVSGYFQNHVTVCRVLDAARADCVWYEVK